MNKKLLGMSLIVALFSSNLYAYESGNSSTVYGGNSPYYNASKQDYSNNRGGNSQYYNANKQDFSNFRGGNDVNYNASDNRRKPVYGDDSSYRGSNGMIYNR